MKYKSLQTILNTFYRGLKPSNAKPRSYKPAYIPSPTEYRTEIYETRIPDFGQQEEHPYSEPYRNELEDEWGIETQRLSPGRDRHVKNPPELQGEAENQEAHKRFSVPGFPLPDEYPRESSDRAYSPLDAFFIESAIEQLRAGEPDESDDELPESKAFDSGEDLLDEPEDLSLEEIIQDELEDDPFEQMPDEMYQDIEPEKLLDPFFLM